MARGDLPLILSVDDERFNLTLIERMLRGAYRVISVTSGQAALDTLAQAPFDLILLDIMMPDMNGLMTLQHIRSNPATADIPVILISALADGPDVANGLEAGANDYITKPIDMDVTRARVRTQVALKQLQDERKQTISELQGIQEMKDRLLRMASHDLKGPLGNIRMAVTLIESAASDIPDGDSIVASIDSSLNTMENVIKDFLDTAALQTGAIDLHFEALPLALVVSSLISEHRYNALRKNIDLQAYEVSGTIYADAARFAQALSNLISNAIKYSARGTKVVVWTEWCHQTIKICVSDEGPGIPVHEHNKLFTQFGKLSPRPTGGESSTGLGLWIVKHLITLQNGQVGYRLNEAGGSTFWIEMPAVDN